MDAFEKLELNTETLRELSSEELDAVAGGMQKPTILECQTTQSPVCPSGATWFASCELSTYCS